MGQTQVVLQPCYKLHRISRCRHIQSVVNVPQSTMCGILLLSLVRGRGVSYERQKSVKCVDAAIEAELDF